MKEPQKVGEIKPKSTVETACVEATAVQRILPFGEHKTFAFQARHSMHCDIPLSRCQHSAPLHHPSRLRQEGVFAHYTLPARDRHLTRPPRACQDRVCPRDGRFSRCTRPPYRACSTRRPDDYLRLPGCLLCLLFDLRHTFPPWVAIAPTSAGAPRRAVFPLPRFHLIRFKIIAMQPASKPPPVMVSIKLAELLLPLIRS